MEDEDPYLPLHRACYEKNSRQLGKYLRIGANVDQRDASGSTPLIVAAKQGAITNAFQLFGFNPEIDARDNQGRTALMYAVSANHDCFVLHLLSRKADPNVQDVLGVTPLIQAVRGGFYHVMKRLLHTVNIKVNATDHEGVTPLYLAAEAGRMDMVSLLIQHRANVHQASCQRKTPLVAAAEKGHAAVVKVLIERGASVNIQDIYGVTALQYACEHGYLDVVKLLYKEGAYMFGRSPSDHSTPLITAVKRGHNDIVAFLVLRAKVNVNAMDVADRTALYYACRDTEIFNLLLENYASPHTVDQGSKTVLMRASQVGNAEACQALLQYTLLNVDSIDTDGKTALMYACVHGKAGAAKVLLDHGASALIADDDDQTPLMLASFMGRDEVVDLLLGQKDKDNGDVGLDYQDCHGRTALHRASTRTHVNIVEKLMKAGACPIVADNDGVTPLMLACSYGDGAMVRAMIAGHKGHINQENHKQQTAVFYACKHEHEECLDLLLDCDDHVDLDKADCRGMTPLMMVSAFGNLVMVTKLVDRGVSLDAQDHGQRTALYYACDTGNSDVAIFLLKRGANAALSNLTLTTPLMLGCLDKDEAIVSAVLGTPTLDHGHVNLVDHHSMNALFHAVSSGHGPSPIVALLLEHGADITIVSDTGATPLMEAADKADLALVNQLMATVADPRALTAYVNVKDDEGQTALHKAATTGSCAVIQRLLDTGASPLSVDAYGNTPLMWAAIRRHVDAVHLLVDLDVVADSINQLNGEHKTVLYYALRSRSHAMIQDVLAHGGDLRLLFDSHAIWSTGYPNDFCMGTLHLIVRHLPDDLLDNVNSQGRTALYQLAFAFGNKCEAIRLFLTRGANPWISSVTATLPIEGARTLMIRRLLQNAMSEPDRTALLHKARLMCDARHHANNFAVTPFVRTRGEKRQKRIAATPYLFKNRVALGDPLPTVEVKAEETLAGAVVQHICAGHLNNDVFHELQAMMQMRWE